MSECKDCGKVLGRENKSGYCKSHISAALARDPAWRENQAKRSRESFYADPVRMAKIRAQALVIGKLPQAVEKRREDCIKRQLWKVGAQHQPAPGSPERMKAGARGSATKLAWCPTHLRAEYRQLSKMKGVGAAEARAMIEEQNEMEMARWRRSIGVETKPRPVVQVTDEPLPEDAFQRAVHAVSRVMGIDTQTILGRSRFAEHARARHMLMFVLGATGWHPKSIAHSLAMERTSVLHGDDAMEHLVATNRDMASQFDAILAMVERKVAA